MKADIGLIGLAVMGENLVLNMADKDFTVAVFNRDTNKVKRFKEGRGKGLQIVGTYSMGEFVESLKSPRIIVLMIKSGQAVDDMIDALIPFLSAGDIIIDGGNSHFQDSIRRTKYVEDKGMFFVASGVSGGEEGALNGPSLMPGGTFAAWRHIEPIFTKIAAKVNNTACCSWIGADGAGHFVKMVHNGIEYGDMQLICEAYHIMRDGLGMTSKQMEQVFREWNKGDLDSYLIEITADILGYQDTDGKPVVDKILDVAGQKGTGKWAVVAAAEEGVPLTLIGEAVFARCLSAMKNQRLQAANILKGQDTGAAVKMDISIDDIRDALFASKIVSYAQGFDLLNAAAKTYGWKLDYGSIALLWRGGCIIRSAFLDKINEAYFRDPNLGSLLLDEYFVSKMGAIQTGWRKIVSQSALYGLPAPGFSSALAYYDGFRCGNLPANLLQAQRDYFGAHTYERVDKANGEFFHTNWTGKGGSTTSTQYIT